MGFSFASSTKGHKTYTKKLRNDCNLSEYEFTQKYTQKNWKNIYDSGKFKEELLKLCPKLKASKIEKINLKDIFDFAYKYAKDTNNIPF